jgi:hypothetical protein
MQKCNCRHISHYFKKYITTSYCDKKVLILVVCCMHQCQLAVHNTTETAVLW